MKIRFGIGQKILMVVVGLLVLFAVGLAVSVGTTSFNNLTGVKQAELERMSQILAEQVADLERDAVHVTRSFEDNEQIARDITLITNLGPYYADPGSYFAEDFTGAGAIIDSPDQIYTFQAYLTLIREFRSALLFNDLSSISFYMISPYSVVPNVEPTLALQINKELIYVNRFINKGNTSGLIHQLPFNQFRPPTSDYFDISTAYSAPAEKFYSDNNFVQILSTIEAKTFPIDLIGLTMSRSQIIIKNGIPVIQTWHPVRLPLPHFETWEEENVVVGLAVVEKELDIPVMDTFKRQLGLDVGIVQGDQLLVNSLQFSPDNAGPVMGEDGIIDVNNGSFYFARQPVAFEQNPNTGLEAVIFSPVSELTRLTQALRSQIIWVSVVAIAAISVAIYMAIQYLVNRPLGALTNSARLISAGNLSQRVAVESQDEAGLLGATFNIMADQLRELIDSLESKVAARTKRLEIVASLGERLNAILHLEELLDEVVNQIKDSFGYYHAHIYLLNEDRTRLVVAAGTGPAGAAMKEKGHHIMLDAPTSLVARSARTGHSVNVSNVREAADWLPNLLLPDTYSEMAVPIVLPGENYVVGVLDVQSDKIAGLDETDASLLRTLASQVAVAINNARLFDQAETALAEAHSAQSRYTEQVWQKARVLSQAGEFRFVRPGFAAIPEEEMINLKQQTLTQAGLVVHESGANATDQTGQNVGPAVTDIGPVITAPVTLHQKSIGVVQLFPVESDQIWPDDDLAIVEAVVDELAQTAENLRLFEETRQRASFESTVGEISGLIRQAPTLDALAKSTAEALGKVLGVSSSLVRIGFSPEQESDIPGPGRPQNGKHS